MQKEELTSQTKKSQEEGYVHIIPDSFCAGTKTMPDIVCYTAVFSDDTKNGCVADYAR